MTSHLYLLPHLDWPEKILLTIYIYISIISFVCFPCFLGNEALHLLTTGTKQELRVDLQKFSGEKAYAKYSTFAVAGGSDKYKLTVEGYRGNAG